MEHKNKLINKIDKVQDSVVESPLVKTPLDTLKQAYNESYNAMLSNEYNLILQALKMCNDDKEAAGKLLGVSRIYIYRRLKFFKELAEK